MELELSDVAQILHIDINCIEVKADGIYINEHIKNKEKTTLQFNDLNSFIGKKYNFNFKFFNFNIQKSTNENITMNSNLLNLEFLNCEFDNFCILSLVAKDIGFTKCFFKNNFIFTDCKIQSFQLNETQIIGEFKLRPQPEFSINSFDCDKVGFHKKASIQGIFKQINLCDSYFKGNLELSNVKVENDLSLTHLNMLHNLIIIKSEINKLHFQSISFVDENQGFKHNNFMGFQVENSAFKDKLNFANCIFDKSVSLFNNIFQSDVCFDKTCFRKEGKFCQNVFEKEISFKDCNLNKNTYFSNTQFDGNAYFNNSTFESYADFHECEFEKNACFYGVTFEKTPNFSQAIFKGNLNLVNTNLNFDFADLKLRIQEEYQKYSENSVNTEKKTLENFTNDFRDSFRIFKATLLEEHNTLDALDYHKAELYCKEIELRQKWDKKDIEAKSETDMRKNTFKFKEFVDCCLLCFYRKLCEHHTDFLRVFNNLILLIALYVAFFCIGNFELLIKNTTDTIKSPIQIHSDFLNMIAEYMKPYHAYILCVCLITLTIVSLKLTIGTSYKSLIRDIVNIMFTTFFILFALAIVDGYAPKEQFHLYDIYLFCFFVVFYLWLVCIRTLFLRYIAICVAYILTFIGIGTSIALINPLIGKLVDDSIKINNSSLLSITFAYTILMALVLFSLQKTARKNSIIPS